MTMTTNATTAFNNIAAASRAESGARPSGNSVLGQQDFLTLMTAQLKNQDPLAPMENGEFLAQMAQFSTVAGIDRVNETLGGMGEGLREARIASAASLLGRQVLVPGAVARADARGGVAGQAELAAAAQAVTVTYSDARTGEILHNQTFGAQRAGVMPFEWTGVPQSLSASGAPIRVSVAASGPDGTTEVGTQVYARVLSARTAPGGADVTLDVEDFGALNALEVEAFR